MNSSFDVIVQNAPVSVKMEKITLPYRPLDVGPLHHYRCRGGATKTTVSDKKMLRSDKQFYFTVSWSG